MFEGRDELTVIQQDIQRALARPDPNWAMLIDLRRCTSCKSCIAGCVAEQKSPPGIMYRAVYEEETGVFPQVKRRFTPRPCQQCDNPPCVAACPNKGEGKATWKSAKGPSAGIVMINYDECLRCGRCVIACPYKARALDRGAMYTDGTPAKQSYEAGPAWEYGKKQVRDTGGDFAGVARKCHFCLHRLKNGMVPMCVSTCICRANYFGDPNDPQSLIHKMIRENKGRIKVLARVKGAGEVPVKRSELNRLSPEDLSTKVGYPGTSPVFADRSVTKPRVFYILP